MSDHPKMLYGVYHVEEVEALKKEASRLEQLTIRQHRELRRAVEQNCVCSRGSEGGCAACKIWSAYQAAVREK